MNKFTIDIDRLIPVCRKYGVRTVSVFGSAARGEAGPDSDLDLLVDFAREISLLKLVALERELSAALGRKVDLLTEAALSPYLRSNILRERRQIYAA